MPGIPLRLGLWSVYSFVFPPFRIVTEGNGQHSLTIPFIIPSSLPSLAFFRTRPAAACDTHYDQPPVAEDLRPGKKRHPEASTSVLGRSQSFSMKQSSSYNSSFVVAFVARGTSFARIFRRFPLECRSRQRRFLVVG
ncbi:hypothetical protein C8J56DRAFT_889567 [Mycena floridula]|nr:hypothetical protein C8J56DRAFT_889567 [Mycena floridula]